MSQRIVITGMGVLSPVAKSLEDLARSLAEGVSGIEQHHAIFPDASIWAGLIRDLDPRDHGDDGDLGEGEFDRTAQFAIRAASQALRDASWSLAPDAVAQRTGLVMGTSHGGRSQLDHFVENRRQLPPHEAARRVLIRAAHASQTNAVALKLGIRGPALTLSNACSSSGAAIAYASELIGAGKCDLVLAGGADAFSKLTYSGFRALGAMADGPCGPFSATIGLSLGEGAGFVAVETLEHARDRGAPIHAELLGHGLSWDAYHITAPEPSGEGMLRALRMAARHAGLEPHDIDYANAHGTGTRSNDVAENLALKRFFEARGGVPPVSATKSQTGHMLGASSVLGLIVSILGMNRDLLPPTVNYVAPRAGCDLDYVPNHARTGRIRHFVAQSAAFGGANAVLIGGRPEPDRCRPARAPDDVLVTGLGVVSPVGCGVAAFRDALSHRRHGIAALDRFPTDGCRARHAALVRDFRPRRVIPTLNLRRVDRVTEFAVVAAGLALQEAGLWPVTDRSDRIGLVVGTTRGAATSYEKFLESVHDRNWTGASAVHFPNLVMSSIGGQVSSALGLRGIASTLVGGVTAGLHALIHGFDLLYRNDAQDAVVIVAADEISPLYFHLYDQLGVLAPSPPADQVISAHPYDPAASGMILGEGAVALVLERNRHARGRDAAALARVAGSGLTTDPEGGQGLRRAIEAALSEAGVGPEALDLIYGHGRGLPAYDGPEARTLAQVLGGRRVPVGCVNGHVGVAEAASGLFSVAAALLGLTRGEAYPLAGSGVAAPDVGLDLVYDGVRVGAYRTALVAGSTEAGNHAALVLARDGAHSAETERSGRVPCPPDPMDYPRLERR